MDSAELARILFLCSRDYRVLSKDEDDELRDLARLAVSEIREHRRLMAELSAQLKRAALESV